MTESKVIQLSPLSLAFVGDAFFTLYIRDRLIERHDDKAGGLHDRAKAFVSAHGQAVLFDRLAALLDERETTIARRARNAHNTTRAKNASLADYKKATAFEAVIGYLHLCGKTERLETLLNHLFTEEDGQEENKT